MASEKEVLLEWPVPNNVASITLCRPKKLNSLSLSMIKDLKQIYGGLAAAGARCVFLKGEGRALCAGGDVAEVRDGVLEGNAYPAEFFYEEYSLDHSIATLYEREKVLQVSYWDGIVMGGGVGLSVHSPVRIATEKALFAMPETAIGLFPDVGATWALSRLTAGKPVGIYLGLTGQRLGAADLLRAGLATHFCPSDRLAEAHAAICGLGEKANDLESVSAAITAVAGDSKPDMSKALIDANLPAIERCFGGDSPTAEEIVQKLKAEGGEWAPKALALLQKMSPTSVKVTLEAISRHRSITLKEAFVAEYRLSQWCMRDRPESDFCEGIRSVLVDKDNKPQWQPASVEEVSKERVEGFFAPLPASHPLGELQL